MSTFTATTEWKRSTPDFQLQTYSRNHEVRFGSGQALAGSSAAEYRGDPTRANPEELLVGALSACHMLTFLALAARDGWVVNSYTDAADGVLARDAAGHLSVTQVVLHPRVQFSGERQPDAAALGKLHASAHRGCFIANSVKTEVRVEF